MLILGRQQLERVLRAYADHHNTARPHQALGSTAPLADGQPPASTGAIVRRDRLGGLIHAYERHAARDAGRVSARHTPDTGGWPR
jgi:hypothetical protein